MTQQSTTQKPVASRAAKGLRFLLFSAIAPIVLAATGCATVSPWAQTASSTGNPLIPTRYQSQAGAFLVASNLPLEADDPALAVLEGLEDRLEQVLGLSVPDDGLPINVYILDDEHAFTTYLTFHHPELPNRRAFFLATGNAATIYTARGEHLEEDLRHEATHALLHRAGGSVPLWLDEGLAEYFEIEPQAVPAEELARFRRLGTSYRQGWRPDLPRLEAIEDVATMSPTDYREAWAWTILLLHGQARNDLMAHLNQLRSNPGSAPALSDSLRRDLPQLNQQFLARVAPNPRSPSGSPSLTRLQSPSATSNSNPATIRATNTPPPSTAPIVLEQCAVFVQPMPAPIPQGPIGRLRSGIGGFFDRLMPSSRMGPG